MREKIVDVISSEAFRLRLNEINTNYPNLKQEGLIRNSILELLNRNFNRLNEHRKAFAEHPRDKHCRVDLSIVDKLGWSLPYLVEFKFQYTGDFKQFLDFRRFVDNDFERTVCGKQTDLFILIVADWNVSEKHDFDQQWRLTSNLSRFLSADNQWKNNINDLLRCYKSAITHNLSIEVDEPYKTTYSFFIVERTVSAANIAFPQAGLKNLG